MVVVPSLDELRELSNEDKLSMVRKALMGSDPADYDQIIEWLNGRHP